MKALNKKYKKRKSTDNQKCENQSNKVAELIVEAKKYYDLKQLQQSNFLYQQVLQLQPDNLIALNALGVIAMDAGMLLLAIDLFKYALVVAPKNIILNKNIALVYSRMAEFNEAIEKYKEILCRDKNNGDVHAELARIYLQTGEIKYSLKHYRKAFKLNPTDPRNFHGLVQLDENAITDKDITMVEGLLSKQDLPLDDRRSFYFALGAIYGASEKYDEAFANYAVANMSKAVNFDSAMHVEYITNVMATFTDELFQNFNNVELCQSSQPIFIIGMPRSGTTLVEKVLASHPDIYAGGELNLISDIAKKLKLTMEQSDSSHMSFEYSSEESLSGFARYYSNDINNLAINNSHINPLRITDKMPTNFIYLGLIALLFPKAHVIHCRRNPLDVSLSCYFHDFAGDHGYACDLKDIGVYYQQYERIMEHWKKVLPMKIHTVKYEEMIEKPELMNRQLIEFVGLDRQPISEYYKNSNEASNSMLLEAEKEMHEFSVERWCYYEKYLLPLTKTLNASGDIDATSKKDILH